MKRLGALVLSAIMSFSITTSALGQEVSQPTEPVQGVNRFVSGTRQAVVRDIVVTENGAGVLKKNKNIYLRADHLQFEKGMTLYITQGDVKVKKVEVDGDTICISIEQESTEPSVITLKNVKLFLDASLPIGVYPLDLVTEESAEYKDNIFAANYSDNDENGKFSTKSVVLMSDFASIEEAVLSNDISTNVSAGEKVAASNPSTETLRGTLKKPIAITVGETEVLLGNKAFTATEAPYLSKEGYVMVPLRLLSQIYPSDIVVKWDDDSKTITLIVFGSMQSLNKIVNMKVGENMMNVNGISTAMQGNAEIVNGSAFVPLRDFGYLLGCDESNITWDAEKNVATVFADRAARS